MTTNEMLTSEVSARIGIVITAQLLRDLGFKPVRIDKRAVLWDADEYAKMCDAIGKHIAAKKTVDRPSEMVKKAETSKEKNKTFRDMKNTGSIDEDDEEL